MEKTNFNQPRLSINRVYTKTGDSGDTSLVGGQRVSKDSLRIESYGTVDELNAFVGMACQTVRELELTNPELGPLATILSRVQHELFNLCSTLATRAEDLRPGQPGVTVAGVEQLEREIEKMNERLPELKSFVLPGGCRINVELHLCRTICRRAERICVRLSREEKIDPESIRYLNRLSDAFFVWSRWASRIIGVPETLWDPNRAATIQSQE